MIFTLHISAVFTLFAHLSRQNNLRKLKHIVIIIKAYVKLMIPIKHKQIGKEAIEVSKRAIKIRLIVIFFVCAMLLPELNKLQFIYISVNFVKNKYHIKLYINKLIISHILNLNVQKKILSFKKADLEFFYSQLCLHKITNC